jgi:dienelactone hydrolase
VADRPEPEKKDSLLESEKVKLDLWHYQDKRLQPQQLVELKRDQKKSDLYLYNLSDKTMLQLSNDTLRIQADDKIVGDYLFASSDEQYSLENQWAVPNREDHYRVSVLDGSVELIKRGVGFNGEMSPSGKYYTYFDAEKTQYYMIDFTKRKEICISCSADKVNWQMDINGMPMTAYPFGTKGYSSGETILYIQSQYDLWSYDVMHNNLTCLTGGEGQQRKIRLDSKKWSYDSVYVDYNNLIIEGFDEKTKGTHLYNLIDHGDHTDLKEIYYTDHSISFMTRSKNKETIVFRKMSLQEYPEVSYTKNSFDDEMTISSTNPQQSEFNWATVELVRWKSYDGIPLEGLLYKPENFDPAKKYPLMIYYYELYSDELHNHYVPKPTASIIYPTEYASAGYLVFIPDIRYKPGYPAKSAYNCIMSGTDHILKLVPNIDSTKMGLQGQSWGGYQTAQLITMTNRYAAAMAGAPVSNMISAYGGIRWGSGVNRQFQYERTQSRIGNTIWSAPELYIENSPVFHIPNIQTPLMIMANDKDGAVPWYQGIEMFTCMKRLGKPCWMLNYNGDDHNLMENSNRIDLSIRMRQFFDYYLLGQPAPKWLTEGIPATVKGKELRYE